MKSVQYVTYGNASVLTLNEIPRPSPGPKEILIKMHATTVTAADIMMREGKPLIGRMFTGLSEPRKPILGFDFAGEVVEIGNQVSLFRKGDRVFGGTTTLGCHAEYKCITEEDVVSTIPERISYEQAAPIAGSAITALHFLKGIADIQKGQNVLINGASGAVGTYAVQYAKFMGAEVTGVCSAGNAELVKSIGADLVFDYTTTDFTDSNEQYNIIFDTVARKTFSECKDSLTRGGIYISTVMNLPLFRDILTTSFFGSKKARTAASGMLSVKTRLAYLLECKQLLEESKMTSVIDSQLPFSFIPEAHRYVERGHKKGNLIIRMGS